jgi:hypothetical protein
VTAKYLRAAEAAAALCLAQVLTRVTPAALTLGRVDHTGADGRPRSGTRDTRAAAIGVALSQAAARLPWNSTCLVRAVAGRLMLSRRGIPAALVVGVRKEAAALDAHAWLECEDGFVCGESADDYVRLATFTG